MNKFLIKLIFLSSFLLIAGFGFDAHAEDEIDVEYESGVNINGDDIFNEDNIYPGWSKSETIRIENKSETDEVNLYFNFDLNGGSDLAKELKLYVIRDDGSYRIGGAGDKYDLEEADDKGDLYVDSLDPEESNQYEIKIEFNKDAGNELQGIETEFDIDFQIESRDADDRTDEQILAGQGRIVTGESSKEESDITSEEQVQGVGTEEEMVAGEETICKSWPLWFWILALIVFTVLSFISTKNTEERKAKKHFFWQLAAVMVMLAVWYFFDKCPYYKWFPISIIIIVILNHFYYQKFGSRKRVMQ